MAQAGQPTKGEPKKFNWVRLIVTILIITGIVLLAMWAFGLFSGSANVVSYSEFKNSALHFIHTNGEPSTIADLPPSRYAIEPGSQLVQHEASNYFTWTDTSHVEHTTYGIGMFYKDFVTPLSGTGTPPHVLPAFNVGINGALSTGINVSSAAIESSVWPAIWEILSMFLPIILIVGFYIWIARKQGMMGGDGPMGTGKNVAKKIESKKRFSDIAGQAEVKEEIEEVVDFLKNPKKYKAAGARIPKGIMLGGPPGTGKTLMAKATAGEAGVPFYFISASNFVEMFAGLGAKRVRTLFSDARKNSPAILFIDEMDAIGRKRGSSLSGNDEREQTLNQILVEMDGMDENTGLLVLAATNRPDVLDPALLRPGRFDRTITVNNPDIKEREAILRLHAKGKRISKEIDFAQVAKRVPGYSGAQLENIVNEASLLSVREDTGVITIAQIDEAIDRVAAGPAKKHRVISPEELKMVAYHEAGHAVIGLKVASSQNVQKITIIPRGDAGGYNLMTPKKETYNHKKSELEAMIMSYMGGRAAEQIVYGIGEVSTGASNDIERATNIARSMVTQFGMSDLGPIAYEKAVGSQYLGQDGRQKDYSESVSERIDEAVRKLIVGAEKKAIEVINKNKKLLELITEELLDKETIVVEEIDYINKHLKRPPKKVIKKEKEKSQNLTDIINEVQKSSDVKESKKKKEKSSSTKPNKADDIDSKEESSKETKDNTDIDSKKSDKKID